MSRRARLRRIERRAPSDRDWDAWLPTLLVLARAGLGPDNWELLQFIREILRCPTDEVLARLAGHPQVGMECFDDDEDDGTATPPPDEP